MQQVLVRLPEDVAGRLRRRIPARQRSAFVQRLIEQALPADEGDDDPLYLAAMAAERDEALGADMAEWDVTVGDGLSPVSSARRD